MDKLVTVIIPAWNAERWIEDTLRSVLGQSHRSLRILVIDDGSTDSTPPFWSGCAGRTRGSTMRPCKTGAPPRRETTPWSACRPGRTM